MAKNDEQHLLIIDLWIMDVINRIHKQTSNVSDARKRRWHIIRIRALVIILAPAIMDNFMQLSIVGNLPSAVVHFITSVELHFFFFFVCSSANPLHSYGLRVPRKADRLHWVWPIFESRTAWADHITCGMSICKVYGRKLKLGWL